MSFYSIIQQYEHFDFEHYVSQVTEYDVQRAIYADHLSPLDYLSLLSPQADHYLEEMAQRAHQLTQQFFGKTMLLFTPLYISNYCVNGCVYCGFNATQKIKRRKLTPDEIHQEAQAIAAQGFQHIIFLTGESRVHTPLTYIEEALLILKQYFHSLTIEIYPLTREEYIPLVEQGLDGLTIFQETYNPNRYQELHPFGPKSNYHFRLDAPEKGCRAGIRTVNIGALLGLDTWIKETFFTTMHAHYLERNYPDTEISVSFPRMRPYGGCYQPQDIVTDKDLVKMILAFRIFMPRGGITISSRECADFRDNLVPLGVTKMSASSITEVGGHAEASETKGQFDISDGRSAEEMAVMLKHKGYQPVFKDWQCLGA